MSFFALFFKVIFKVIPYLYPFVKEMLIGKKTWLQAFRDNRYKATLAFFIIMSVLLNVWLSAKVGSLAYQVLELSRAKEEIEHKYAALEKAKPLVEGSAKHPIANNTEVAAEVKQPAKVEPPKTVVVAKPNSNIAAEVKAEFERIREREAITEPQSHPQGK